MKLCPTVLYRHILVLNVAGVVQTLEKCSHEVSKRVGRRAAEKPDDRHCRLLRLRDRRPRCSAPESRDEGAAVHSMTSSARASSVGRTSRPSALAVFRLM